MYIFEELITEIKIFRHVLHMIKRLDLYINMDLILSPVTVLIVQLIVCNVT